MRVSAFSMVWLVLALAGCPPFDKDVCRENSDCLGELVCGKELRCVEASSNGETCGPSNCGGCCGDGGCLLGDTVSACGVDGGQCVECGTDEGCVEGVCTKITYRVVVTKDGTGGGAVTSTPSGIVCGSTCSESYDLGTAVTLRAEAHIGSDFTGWTGEDCDALGGDCTILMTQNRDVTANFRLRTHMLMVSKAGSGFGGVQSDPGGIDCGEECASAFDHGTTVTLTATPAGGTNSVFAGWEGAGCSEVDSCSVSMTEPHTVKATFTCAVSTCDDLQAECGEHDDGCGGTATCGGCSAWDVCEAGACVPVGGCGDECGEMVTVEAGPFGMGCDDGADDECWAAEYPHHVVDVSEFEIDKYQVTMAQYEACVTAEACTAPGTSTHCNANHADRHDHPVNCITWSQARAYCEWAEKRLCTEAEWEKAARGTDGRVYPWGNETPTCEYAVFDDESEGESRGCGEGSTWPVGSKPAGASPYGALDMAGNVEDWVEDDWHQGYEGAPQDGSAWVADPRSDDRVIRGGCAISDAKGLRASSRSFDVHSGALTWTGVRCCKSVQ